MTISTQDLLIAVRRKLIASSEVTSSKDRVHISRLEWDIELPAIIEQVEGRPITELETRARRSTCMLTRKRAQLVRRCL